MPLVPRTARPAVVSLGASGRNELLGTYDLRLPSGRLLPARIFVVADTLKAEIEGLGPGVSTLLYHGNDVFTFALDPRVRLTFMREQGMVSSVRVVHGDSTYGEELYEGRKRR